MSDFKRAVSSDLFPEGQRLGYEATILWERFHSARRDAMRQRECLIAALVAVTGCDDPRQITQVEQHCANGTIHWHLEYRPRHVVDHTARVW